MFSNIIKIIGTQNASICVLSFFIVKKLKLRIRQNMKISY